MTTTTETLFVPTTEELGYTEAWAAEFRIWIKTHLAAILEQVDTSDIIPEANKSQFKLLTGLLLDEPIKDCLLYTSPSPRDS